MLPAHVVALFVFVSDFTTPSSTDTDTSTADLWRSQNVQSRYTRIYVEILSVDCALNFELLRVRVRVLLYFLLQEYS